MVVSSITTAQRLQKLLQARRIPHRMLRTPQGISGGGCSYSLCVEDVEKTLAILEEAHLSYKAVYRQTGAAQFEKIQ